MSSSPQSVLSNKSLSHMPSNGEKDEKLGIDTFQEQIMDQGEKVTDYEASVMCSKEKVISPSNRGYPGFLTKSEFRSFLQFREEVNKRPSSFRDVIFSYGNEEDESYALCRWLRFRKFCLKRTVRLIEESVKFRAKAAEMKFYPDATDALGVEISVYKAVFPEFFVGHSKEGYPVVYSQLGKVDTKMLFSVTTVEQVLFYRWHFMHHALGGRFREKKSQDTTFQRFETSVVIDLKHLSINEALSFLPVMKKIAAIDDHCFPESLHRCIIVNAPTAFSAVWVLIKRIIDPRIAARVDIFASNRDKWQKRLLEFIDESEIPQDYGGTGPSMEEVYKKATKDPDVKEQFLHPITTNAYHQEGVVLRQVKLDVSEELELTAFTKSKRLTKIYVSEKKEDGNKIKLEADIVHKEGQKEGDAPSRIPFSVLKGPGEFNIKLSSERREEKIVLLGKVRC